MPRKYTRKTNRGQTQINVLKRAAGALRQSGKLWQSAQEFNVSKTTLKRFVDQMLIDEDIAKKSGYKCAGDRHRIFSTKMEEDLANHIKPLSNIFYGLSTNKCHRLAFKFAMTGAYHLSLNMDYLCKNLQTSNNQYLKYRFSI